MRHLPTDDLEWGEFLRQFREAADTLSGTDAGEVARVWLGIAETRYQKTSAFWAAFCDAKRRSATPLLFTRVIHHISFQGGVRHALAGERRAKAPLRSNWKLDLVMRAATRFAQLGVQDGADVDEVEVALGRCLTQDERWAVGLAAPDRWLDGFTAAECQWARRVIGTPKLGVLPWSVLAERIKHG